MKKRILIVEDEQDMRDAMSDALEQRGYEVLVAENGEVGLSLATQERPDFIILDLLMPKVGGQEMLEYLRRDPWGKDVKVLILTAMDDVQNVAEGYQKGITDYVIKSSASLDDIVRKVSTAIHVS